MSFLNPENTTPFIVIGISHGYVNTKTASACFKTGLSVYGKEPPFTRNLPVYDGRCYIFTLATI